jgi:uracil-DNA glycosylase
VADYLQERVFDNGPQLRLDAQKLVFRNAFDSATQSKLDFTSSVVETQRVSLSQQLEQFHPPVVFTFGDEAYRFVSYANAPDKPVPLHRLKLEDLGKRFRDVCEKFDPREVNIFPLLHASVARASWAIVGKRFSGPDEENNYFRYVGQKLGDVLLRYGRDWPIWRNKN